MQRLIGSHLSIAGGYYKAADAAGALGMATVQIFTKSSNQWRGKPLTDEDVRLWKEAVARNKIQIPCSHDSYLINLGSVNDELWNKSIDAFVMELERAEALGLAGVVTHPGAALKRKRTKPWPVWSRPSTSSMTAQPGFRCRPGSRPPPGKDHARVPVRPSGLHH